LEAVEMGGKVTRLRKLGFGPGLVLGLRLADDPEGV